MADTEEGRAAHVVEALARVVRDMPGIAKALDSQQGYKYRGIEQVTAELQPLLAKHGVIFTPRVAEWQDPRTLTINNKPWTDERVLVTYRVYGPAGRDDYIDIGPIPAIGRDNSDKGANKCMTQAFKYALLQTLCIGDSKDDADNQTHQADAAPVDPRAVANALLKVRLGELAPEHRAAYDEWRTSMGTMLDQRYTRGVGYDQGGVEIIARYLDELTGESDAPDAPRVVVGGGEPGVGEASAGDGGDATAAASSPLAAEPSIADQIAATQKLHEAQEDERRAQGLCVACGDPLAEGPESEAHPGFHQTCEPWT